MIKVLAMIGFLATHSSYTAVNTLNESELYCVAKAVYSEARGEDAMGQAAVAWAIKHRVNSGEFPDSACKVIYEVNSRGVVQFPGIRDIDIDQDSKEWDSAVEIATLSWIGWIDDPTGGKRFWYNSKKVPKPKGRPIKTMIAIGDHVFYDYKKKEENKG